MQFQDLKNGRFYNEDCFEAMKEIPDGVIDMILCDLPYGTTQNKWDSVLPLDKLWAEYWRICKGVVILTATQPFSSNLVVSQLDNFKYEWIWHKSKVTGVLNAKRQPLRQHEAVLVFCKNSPAYNAQGTIPTSKRTRTGKRKTGESSHNYGTIKETEDNKYEQTTTNWPKSVLQIGSEGKPIHPTQKPVALFEYLIKTYTNENELILDNTAGSGTTAIAAINTNRKWVCIEKDADYYAKAIERINDHPA